MNRGCRGATPPAAATMSGSLRPGPTVWNLPAHWRPIWNAGGPATTWPRVRREERARAERNAAVMADLTRRFVDGPVVRLSPGREFSFSFDPTAVQNFREGTVHRTLRISDEWGVLEVSANGVWLSRVEGRITAVVLPAPSGSEAPVKGDGWELKLAEGWQVVAGARAGDWVVAKR